MNALSNTLSEIVAYSLDAVIPEHTISEITTYHEVFHHNLLSEIASYAKGQAFGELTRHNNGETIDERQFDRGI